MFPWLLKGIFSYPQEKGQAKNLPPDRLLVVSGDEEFQNLVGFLRDNNYEVYSASSFEDGLINMKEIDFDLVLLDEQIGDLGAIEFIEKARKYSPDLIFIVAVSSKTKQYGERSMKVGACDYCIKPFDQNEILPMIRAALGPE